MTNRVGSASSPRRPARRDSGFTFIELLVSITIVAVMMSVAIVSYANVNQRSRDSKRRADLETIRSALEICRANTGSYPVTIISDTGGIDCVDDTTTLTATPADPLNTGVHVYSYNRDSTTTYTLTAQLELPANPTAYQVTNP